MTHSTPENSDTTNPPACGPWGRVGRSAASRGHVSRVLGCPLQGIDAEHIKADEGRDQASSLCAEARASSCLLPIMDRKSA